MKLTVEQDNLADIMKQIAALASKKVLVGVPAADAERQDGEPITNADLAYIHDNGAPGANIPPRPFMQPGIEEAKDKVVSQLGRAITGALNNRPEVVDAALHGAGLQAQSSIKNKINEGPFEALKASTLAARQRRGVSRDKPLIDTGQLRNSISYVIKDS